MTYPNVPTYIHAHTQERNVFRPASLLASKHIVNSTKQAMTERRNAAAAAAAAAAAVTMAGSSSRGEGSVQAQTEKSSERNDGSGRRLPRTLQASPEVDPNALPKAPWIHSQASV